MTAIIGGNMDRKIFRGLVIQGETSCTVDLSLNVWYLNPCVSWIIATRRDSFYITTLIERNFGV